MNQRQSSRVMAAGLAASLLWACAGGPAQPPAARVAETAVQTRLAVSDGAAPVGALLTVQLYQQAAIADLRAVQGFLEYDPLRLEFIGQPLDRRVLVLVNATQADQGSLRVITTDQRPLAPLVGEFVFRVRQPGFTNGLRFRFEAAATTGLRLIDRDTPVADLLPSLPQSASPVAARRLAAADWTEYLAPRSASSGPAVSSRPGEGLIFGDATLDGFVSVRDVVTTSNVSVGLSPLLSDPTKDFAVAANVAPFNLPGLGEATDSFPPGREADGSSVINVLDVVAISNGAVGNASPVVGLAIPGRLVATNRVVLTGTLTASRRLAADTVYELQGTVAVAGPAVLTIDPGTRIEGDPVTRGELVIGGGAKIDARGTRLLPIVFTCKTGGTDRGCWGGLTLNGFALLNNGDILPGGVDVNGCPQKQSPNGTGYYGGCLVQNSSGTLRYVRVEQAGRAPTGQGPVPGLSLLGVGTGTTIDSVQVVGSLGDGLFISGGGATLRNIVLANNAAAGLRWDDGWVGKAQFLVVQQADDNRNAIEGSNYPPNPDSGPRSAPQLYNVTVVGPGNAAGAVGAGILLRDGSGITIRNAVILRPGAAGLDIKGAASCAIAQGTAPRLLIENSVFFLGSPDFATGDDCNVEAAIVTDPLRGNRVADPGLVAPFVTSTADLRPLGTSILLAGYATPPADGFFDTSALYVGAVAPANATTSNVPWYAGWTKGF
jgi:hypothetical protein